MPKSTPKSRSQKDRSALVQAPLAQNKSSQSKMKSVETHRECERVMTVSGSTAFASVGNIAANPGLPEFAPWLSGVAQKYERYIFDTLILRYKNLKGANNDGNILVSFDYDTLDPGPTTAIEQTQSTVWKDGAPWRIFQMNVPCDQQKRFIRTGPLAGVDLKTYDLGRFWISAEGCANTSDQGYLEMEYSVRLFEKQSGAHVTANNSLAMYNLSANQVTGGSAILDIDELVVAPAVAPPTNLNGVVTLPLGNFLVTAQVAWTAAAIGSVQIRQDGAALPIPALLPINGAGNGSISAYIRSVGGTTVDVYWTDAGTDPTFTADACRLMIQVV